MYAWVLCVFTVIMAYSITCPIITPFGEWLGVGCWLTLCWNGSAVGRPHSARPVPLHTTGISPPRATRAARQVWFLSPFC